MRSPPGSGERDFEPGPASELPQAQERNKTPRSLLLREEEEGQNIRPIHQVRQEEHEAIATPPFFLALTRKQQANTLFQYCFPGLLWSILIRIW